MYNGTHNVEIQYNYTQNKERSTWTTLSITTISFKCHYAEYRCARYHYAECRVTGSIGSVVPKALNFCSKSVIFRTGITLRFRVFEPKNANPSDILPTNWFNKSHLIFCVSAKCFLTKSDGTKIDTQRMVSWTKACVEQQLWVWPKS